MTSDGESLVGPTRRSKRRFLIKIIGCVSIIGLASCIYLGGNSFRLQIHRNNILKSLSLRSHILWAILYLSHHWGR